MNEKNQKSTNPPEKKRNPIASVFVVTLGVASAAWLLLPIPDLTDIVPVLGNIDEAAATAVIISCFAYFGLDIGAIFGRFSKDATAENEAKTTKGEVIDS